MLIICHKSWNFQGSVEISDIAQKSKAWCGTIQILRDQKGWVGRVGQMILDSPRDPRDLERNMLSLLLLFDIIILFYRRNWCWSSARWRGYARSRWHPTWTRSSRRRSGSTRRPSPALRAKWSERTLSWPNASTVFVTTAFEPVTKRGNGNVPSAMLLLAPAIIIAFIWPDFSVSGSSPTWSRPIFEPSPPLQRKQQHNHRFVGENTQFMQPNEVIWKSKFWQWI